MSVFEVEKIKISRVLERIMSYVIMSSWFEDNMNRTTRMMIAN